jgi:hypothetical protein
MTDIDINTIPADRDRLVISRSLAWAIVTIEQLPPDLRTTGEDGDVADMRDILKVLITDENRREGWLADMRRKIAEARNRRA